MFLVHYEAIVHFILAVPNSLPINTYTRIFASKFSVVSKWASKHLWGTIYFDVDGTFA